MYELETFGSLKISFNPGMFCILYLLLFSFVKIKEFLKLKKQKLQKSQTETKGSNLAPQQESLFFQIKSQTGNP